MGKVGLAMHGDNGRMRSNVAARSAPVLNDPAHRRSDWGTLARLLPYLWQ
jgi:hypothetical protein